MTVFPIMMEVTAGTTAAMVGAIIDLNGVGTKPWTPRIQIYIEELESYPAPTIKGFMRRKNRKNGAINLSTRSKPDMSMSIKGEPSSTSGREKLSLWGLLTRGCMSAKTFLRMALGLYAIRLVMFVLVQTVIPVGSYWSARLSLDSDLLSLAIALFSMARARDWGRSGLWGFFGSLIAWYGVLFAFSRFFRWIDQGVSGADVIIAVVVAYAVLLAFLLWLGTRPTALQAPSTSNIA